jgi:hypothetical protein
MKPSRLEWEKIKLDDTTYESAGVFDVNRNGHLDIVCGGFWYAGPDFKTRHKLCDVRAEDEYYDDFSTIALDVNGNGYLDVITGGWWGQTLYWRENPQGEPIPWKTHEIDSPGNIETTRAWDVDGDGIVEICPNTPGHPLVFYKLNYDAQGKPTGTFRKITITEEQSTHGLGFGDINGNGRGDFVVPNGWWEAPTDPLEGSWIFHNEFELGSASVPILVVDVTGNGKNDLIVGQAHNYGLDWYEQIEDTSGKRIWKKHPIDPFFSQYHDIQWVDIDGDGQCELLAGNRYRAHCGNDPGETEVVGFYIFKWNGEYFTKQVVDHGLVGTCSGAGIFFSVADLDGNGLLDIVAPGKEGLYLFKNKGFADH